MVGSLVSLLRQRRLRSWTRYLLCFLLGVLLTAGGYIYLTREKPFSPEDFSKKVFLADQVIHGQLYQIGISKKDVISRQSVVKREGDMTWEESLLKIVISPSLSLPLIEENFKRGLFPLGRPVHVKSARTSNSLQLEVKVMGRMTHHLTFVYARPPALGIGLRPRVAFVIDDLGAELSISREVLRWDVPLTLSILPFTPYAKTIALEAQQRGKEVILHLPMEPHDYPKIKPGQGALLQKMDEKELLRQLSRDIEAVPHIKGVSNHMGSRLMEDPEKMRIILSELKRRGLFFLDSRTTAQTVGLQTAKSLGLAALERNVFLDNSQNESDIKTELERLVQISLSTGKAIAIGHPHPSTIKSLKEMIPKIKEKGIDIVPLSSLLE
ncbi:MAG: divergent polysaccharide deacetylase family protein [Syntrophaceae bacterium]|nr:divergent polysaccharide deacetylase family protein [Syntrophaceae bacterium]